MYLQEEADGVSQQIFVSRMKSIGYHVPKRTFSKWVQDMKSQGCVGVENPHFSKQKALSDEQRQLMIEWILPYNQTHQIVVLPTMFRRCLPHLG